jgi:hypothetical protein
MKVYLDPQTILIHLMKEQKHLRSENKMSTTSNSIILKEFVHTKYSVLYDSTIGQNVTVETHSGIPFLQTCKADDCGHVGFAIYFLKRNMRPTAA